MEIPVIAIGLDAADPTLIEKWIAQGHLPNLSQLRSQGAYARLKTYEYYRAETPWTTFLTGFSPQQTGYWAPLKIKPGTYQLEDIQAYDFTEHQPFYALGDDYRVAVFDMPQAPISKEVNGLQVLAWGAHSPQTPSISEPVNLYNEIIASHGEHPTLREDHACVLDVSALKELQHNLEVGIARRAAICQDLLQRDNWDLFLTVFGETHSAGHYFWHLSEPNHPLYPILSQQYGCDPLLSVFKAIDTAIGEIVKAAPADARVVVFAVHGMGNNVMDLPSMLFLPEFLYRWSFPGKAAIANSPPGTPVGNPITEGRAKRGWMGTVWSQKHEANPVKGWLRRTLPRKIFDKIEPIFGKSSEPELRSPFAMMAENDPFFFQSPAWYQPFWSTMKAFALPSYSEGYIRINLKGREPQGIVTPAEYDQVCEDITRKLYELFDARTGEPMVKDIIRTRQTPFDQHPKLPDADLVVIWQEKYATDTVESLEIGRIGPVPFNRTGSHRADGFVIAQGQGIPQYSSFPEGHSLDLAPTILSLMGAPIPVHYQGKPMIETETPATVPSVLMA